MATKKVSFRDQYSRWSEQESRREAQEALWDTDENRQAELESILAALRAEGATDAMLEEAARQYMETGEINVAEQPAAAPVLPSEQAPDSDRPMPQMSAISAQDAFDLQGTSAGQLASDFGARLRAGAREGLAGLLTAPADLLNASVRSPTNVAIANKLGVTLPSFKSFDFVQQEADRLRAEADAIREQELSARSRMGDDVLGESEGFFNTLGTVAGNPTIALDQTGQLVGQMIPGTAGAPVGPTGMIVAQAASAAGQQAEQARETIKATGGDEDQQEAAANIAALSSFTVNTLIPKAVPGGSALEELVSRGVGQAAGRSAARAALVPLTGEAASEGVTEALDQAGLNVATGRPVGEGVSKAGALGFALGKVAGAGPAVVAGVQADRARRARIEDNEANILAGAGDEVSRAGQRPSAPILPTEEPAQGDLFGTTDDAPSFEAQEAERQRQLEEDAAWAQRNRDREAEEQSVRREELRNSYVERVDNARQEVEQLQDLIESGNTDSATLNAATAAQRKLMDAENSLRSLDEAFAPRQEVEATTEQAPVEEAEPVQRDFVQEQQEQERVRRINEIAKRRTAVQKKQQTKAKAEEAKLKTLRTRAVDALIEENPNLTDAQIADRVEAKMAEMQQPKKPAVKKQPARQAQPEATPAEPKADVEKLKASDDPLDRAQAEVLERLGQAAPQQEATTDYSTKVKRIAKALANSASGRAEAVEKLIKQGKVVILPNATALGRGDVARAGEYDTSTGTTYLYTDYLADNDLADVLEAAAHESTHLGQFNGRDARNEKLKALLGDKGVQEGARKLRAAAAKGNKFAQEALASAEADTASRNGDNRYEDLELVAYAVGADNRARASTLGSAAGAMRDLVSGAKDQVRNKLGINLDLSLNDLRAAMGKVLDEAVATTPVLEATPEVLGMIYNVRPDRPTQGQREAIEQGRIYDSVDGTQKFVLSDADAFVDRDKLKQLADNPGTTMKLGEILEHDVLYRERPGAYSIPVSVVEDLGGEVRGQYMPGKRSITLKKSIALHEDPYAPTAREILMHEVQHYVQDIDGRNTQFHDNRANSKRVSSERTKLDRAATANELAVDILLENAPKQLNGEWNNRVREILDQPNVDKMVKAAQVYSLIQEMPRVPVWLRPMVEDFAQTREAYNKQVAVFNQSLYKAHADYMANIAEREAHFTQYNVDASQRELDFSGNPENEMRIQEQDIFDGTDITGGRIDVPQGDGTVSARSFSPEEREAMQQVTRAQEELRKALRAYTPDTDSQLRALVNDVVGRSMRQPGDAASKWRQAAKAVRAVAEQAKNTSTPLGRIAQARRQAEELDNQKAIDKAITDTVFDLTDKAIEGSTPFTKRQIERAITNFDNLADFVQDMDRITSVGSRPILGMAAKPRRVEVLDILYNSTFYRGSRSAGDIPSVSDGALGPGHYLTSDRAAAEGYGPNVGEWQVDVVSPLVIEMEDVEKFEGNTARALVENERFWKENFNTKGGAISWANEQWDDWAGIGDPDFTSMLRDAGFDSVALMNGRDVVELNVPSRRQIVAPSDTTLGMAARRGKAAFRNRNKATTFITAGLRNDKGLGTHVRNEVELAKAAPVEFEAQANRAAGQYDAAIRRQAKQRGVSPEELNREIRDKLEAIAEMPGSASEYRAAFNKIADAYGDAGKQLKRLRGLVDDLSTEFIRTYLDSGAKLTNKEKDDIKKVAANLGRYVHRFYASRLGGGAGKIYSQAVQDAVDAAKEKGVKSLTPKQKELYDRYANAAKVILDGVMIPDEAGLASLPTEKLDYLYDTWFGTDSTGMTAEEKRAELLQRRQEIGPEDLDNKVEAATQALLWGAEQNAATRYYDRGEKLDTTIMQKRSRIPKEIRELLGEVTDPAGALLTTVSKQAEYVSRTKLMFALRDMAAPEDLQAPGSAGNRFVRENNMTELTGESYGPLRGYYASPSLRAMIDDTAESLMNFTDAMLTNSRNGEAAIENLSRGAARVWMKGASKAKAINIVGNLFRYPLNFAGSFAMLGVNGNLNVKSYGRGLKDAVNIIRYAARPSEGLGSAVLANKYRVVDSATVGDLKLLDLGKIEQVVREMSGKSPGSFMRKARELGMAGRELYAMMDVWSKIANFHAEADFLKSLYKAEGITKTDDEIYREASDIVNNTNMSYSRTAPFIKTLERGGITQYAPYLYEAHRVVFANVYQGVREMVAARDLSNPKAKAMMIGRATARLGGTASVLGMLGFMSKQAAGMWGDDEEDKRALLPEYARVMDFLNVGVDEQGKPILFGVSNIDPLGPITDLYRAARTSNKPAEALWEQFKENYIAPSLAGATWDAVARTTGIVEPTSSRPRKPLLQQWSPNGWSNVVGATGNEDAIASIVHLVETRFAPGTVRGWSESNPTAVGNDMDSVAWNIARAIGARAVRYDPKVGATGAYFDYDATMKDARRQLTAYVENTTNPTAEEITKRVLDLRQQEKKQWDQLAKVYRGLQAVGLSSSEALALLKDVGVPKEVMDQLDDEEFRSRVVSEQSLKNAAKIQIGKAKTDTQKAQLEEKWNTAMEILSALEVE